MAIGNRMNLFYMWLLAATAATYVQVKADAPCMLVFGDSLSDHGNNNNLATSAKFNYLPYGIDFPAGPTGRPTNGRTAPDFLSEFMGLPLIPPFANTLGSDILKGVDYASSSAGILVETGKRTAANIDMDAQIRNHGVTIGAIAARLGGTVAAQNYLSKCLYYVNIGSNDYLNNYFLPQLYPTSRIYNVTQFADVLITQYSLQLRALHVAGGRKFALVSLGLLGCAPGSIAAANNGNGCVAEQNAAISIFNGRLRAWVDQLNSDLSDASVIFVNSTAILTLSPDSRGIKVQNASCCQTLPVTGVCVALSRPCSNRKEYAFWDGFHPTEAVNAIFAKSAYNASNPAFTYPTNILSLLSS